MTQCDLVIKGVVGIANNLDPQKLVTLTEVHSLDQNANMVLGGCHTLANIDNVMIGDPIEK